MAEELDHAYEEAQHAGYVVAWASDAVGRYLTVRRPEGGPVYPVSTPQEWWSLRSYLAEQQARGVLQTAGA